MGLGDGQLGGPCHVLPIPPSPPRCGVLGSARAGIQAALWPMAMAPTPCPCSLFTFCARWCCCLLLACVPLQGKVRQAVSLCMAGTCPQPCSLAPYPPPTTAMPPVTYPPLRPPPWCPVLAPIHLCNTWHMVSLSSFTYGRGVPPLICATQPSTSSAVMSSCPPQGTPGMARILRPFCPPHMWLLLNMRDGPECVLCCGMHLPLPCDPSVCIGTVPVSRSACHP